MPRPGERRREPPLVSLVRHLGIAAVVAIALGAGVSQWIQWQMLEAVRSMKAPMPDTVIETRTDTLYLRSNADTASRNPF